MSELLRVLHTLRRAVMILGTEEDKAALAARGFVLEDTPSPRLGEALAEAERVLCSVLVNEPPAADTTIKVEVEELGKQLDLLQRALEHEQARAEGYKSLRRAERLARRMLEEREDTLCAELGRASMRVSELEERVRQLEQEIHDD